MPPNRVTVGITAFALIRLFVLLTLGRHSDMAQVGRARDSGQIQLAARLVGPAISRDVREGKVVCEGKIEKSQHSLVGAQLRCAPERYAA
jgi:hypothetical protein